MWYIKSNKGRQILNHKQEIDGGVELSRETLDKGKKGLKVRV